MSNLYEALSNIKEHTHTTPLAISTTINSIFKHNIYFKLDSLQQTGSFKIRGSINNIMTMYNKNALPKKIVCYSSGNHGIAISWIGKKFNIKTKIYFPNNTNNFKYQLAKKYGAEIIIKYNRENSEIKAYQDSIENQYHFIHPSASNTTIAGSGTMCYEALKQIPVKPDAIFASIGGGGLISGSYIAKELLSHDTKLYGVEPYNADDAYLSKKYNKIIMNESYPKTIADGLRTLKISSETFHYIKKIDGIYRVKEKEIDYYTYFLNKTLKTNIEPSSACAMAGAVKWLSNQKKKRNVIVLVSGGNLSSINSCLAFDAGSKINLDDVIILQ